MRWPKGRVQLKARKVELLSGWSQRQHFMSIGNFRHAPNWDALEWLASGLWRQIRCNLQQHGIEAELHVYGAYPPSKEAIAQLHEPGEGMIFKGHAPSLEVRALHTPCSLVTCMRPSVPAASWHRNGGH